MGHNEIGVERSVSASVGVIVPMTVVQQAEKDTHFSPCSSSS